MGRRMSRGIWRTTGLAAIAVVALLSGCTPAPTTVGVTVPGRSSTAPAISADGRWVAFEANDPSYPPGSSDLYLYDRTTATTTLVAHDTGLPAISGDGRYVAFSSPSDLLGTGSTHRQVFTWDRVSGTFTQLTHGSKDSGADEQYAVHASLAISADGTTVAFATAATDLVPGGNPAGAVVEVDRATGATTEVHQAGGGSLSYVSLSSDGRFASFIVHSPTVDAGTLYRHDRVTNQEVEIGVTASASMSGDGSKVAYAGYDPDRTSVIVVWGAGDGTTAPTTTYGPTTGAQYQVVPSISADGTSVAYARQGFYDGKDIATATWDVYVWDVGTGAVTQVTAGGATGWSHLPSMSGDGKTVAFMTSASAVVPGATSALSAIAIWHRS